MKNYAKIFLSGMSLTIIALPLSLVIGTACLYFSGLGLGIIAGASAMVLWGEKI